MKHLQLRLDQDEDVIHPMHEFVADHGEYDSYRLLQWNPAVDKTNTMIFYVEGPLESYVERLRNIETVLEHETITSKKNAFFVYVRERLNTNEQRLTSAFTDGSLIVIPPLTYRSDHTIDLSVVGTATSLQQAFSATPAGVNVQIRRISPYHARQMGDVDVLSDRQAEAAEVALETGYYETPRRSTVADVAAQLDCAPGTAAEHLRKAEAALVHHALD